MLFEEVSRTLVDTAYCIYPTNSLDTRAHFFPEMKHSPTEEYIHALLVLYLRNQRSLLERCLPP